MTTTYRYYWTGLDKTGRWRRGQAAASDSRVIIERLASSGVVVMAIRYSWCVLLQAEWWRQWVRGRTVISPVLAGMVCRHLAALQRAGVPLINSLQAIQSTIGSEAVGTVVAAIEERVRGGDSLADAFVHTAQWWPTVVPVVISAGEHAGRLPDFLEQLADALSAKDYYIKRVWQAVSVPLLTLGVGCVVLTGVVVIIVPLLASLSASGSVTPSMRCVLRISVFLQSHGVIIIGGTICSVLGGWHCLSFSVAGCQWRDGIIYRLPVVGPLWAQGHALVLLRLLPVLLNAGVPLVTALSLIAPIPANAYWCYCLEQVAASLRIGTSLPVALAMVPHVVVPPVVGQVLALGQSQQGVAHLSEHAAVLVDQQLSHLLSVRLALLQPLLMIAIGGGVLLVIYIFIAPLLSIMGDVGGVNLVV